MLGTFILYIYLKQFWHASEIGNSTQYNCFALVLEQLCRPFGYLVSIRFTVTITLDYRCWLMNVTPFFIYLDYYSIYQLPTLTCRVCWNQISFLRFCFTDPARSTPENAVNSWWMNPFSFRYFSTLYHSCIIEFLCDEVQCSKQYLPDAYFFLFLCRIYKLFCIFCRRLTSCSPSSTRRLVAVIYAVFISSKCAMKSFYYLIHKYPVRIHENCPAILFCNVLFESRASEVQYLACFVTYYLMLPHPTYFEFLTSQHDHWTNAWAEALMKLQCRFLAWRVMGRLGVHGHGVVHWISRFVMPGMKYRVSLLCNGKERDIEGNLRFCYFHPLQWTGGSRNDPVPSINGASNSA